jgi:hypothetical protein
MRHDNDAVQRRFAALPVVAILAGLAALGFGVAADYSWAVRLAGLGLALIAVQVLLAGLRRGPRAASAPISNKPFRVEPLDVTRPPVRSPARQEFRPLPDVPPAGLHQPVVLDDLMQQAVDGVRPSAEARGHRLEVEIDLHGERVGGNSRQLRQVLVVLLADAVRSTTQDGTITVRARCDGDSAVVSIGNSGVGLGRDLSRVREIAAQHGGRLDVRLTDDGSERIVTLPVLARAA